MMKKTTAILLDFLMYVGSLVFVSAFILALVVSEKQHSLIIDVLPIFAVVLGFATLVFTFVISHKADRHSDNKVLVCLVLSQDKSLKQFGTL